MEAIPTELIRLLEVRLDNLMSRGAAVDTEIQELEEQLRSKRALLDELADEYARVKDLLRTYLAPQNGDEEGDTDSGDAPEALPGTTETIINMLTGQPGHAMPAKMLVDRVVGLIESGQVRTESTNARKLVSSTISVLQRRGKLHRNGDGMVTLSQ